MLRRACGRLGLSFSRAARTSASRLAPPPRRASRERPPVAAARPPRARPPRKTTDAVARCGVAPPSHGIRGLSAMSWRPGDDARRDKPDVTAAAAPPTRAIARRPRTRAQVMASLPSICPGCGVGLQCEDKNLPGFFVIPKRLFETPAEDVPDEDGDALDDLAEEPPTTRRRSRNSPKPRRWKPSRTSTTTRKRSSSKTSSPATSPWGLRHTRRLRRRRLSSKTVGSTTSTSKSATRHLPTRRRRRRHRRDDDASVMSGAGGGGYADEDDALAALDALFDEPEDAREVAVATRGSPPRFPDAVVCARCSRFATTAR